MHCIVDLLASNGLTRLPPLEKAPQLQSNPSFATQPSPHQANDKLTVSGGNFTSNGERPARSQIAGRGTPSVHMVQNAGNEGSAFVLTPRAPPSPPCV